MTSGNYNISVLNYKNFKKLGNYNILHYTKLMESKKYNIFFLIMKTLKNREIIIFFLNYKNFKKLINCNIFF